MAIRPANHFSYQLANVFLLLSYASPNMLLLRLLLAGGNLCFTLWGALALSISLDTAGVIMYGKRRVKFPPDLEAIYHNLFRTHLTRAEFQKLTKNKIFEREIKPGRLFAEAGDHCINLGIILEGEVEITKKSENGAEVIVNTAKQFQFVGSPEFLSGKKEFEVTVRARGMTKIYCWPLEILRPILKKNPRFHDALVAAISQDLAMKLFTANDHVMNDKATKVQATPISSGIESHPAFQRTLSTGFIKEIKVPMSEKEKREVFLPV